METIANRELRRKLEIVQKEKDGIQLNVDKFDHASKSLNKLIESQIVDICKKRLGYENYNAVPPPYTGNFMPLIPDLSFTGLDEFVNEPIVENSKAMSSEEEPKVVRKNNYAPIIEEWVSDDEEEDVSQPKIEKKTVRPSIVKKEFFKSKQQEKTTRKIVKQVEQHRQNTHSLRVDCNYHQMMVKPVWNNAQKVNHQNFAKKTHPCAKKNLVPRAVLMKSGLVSVNTARQVNAAHSKTTVNAARPMSYLSKIAHSTVKRPIHKNTSFKNSNFNQRVNTVKDKKFNTARPKAVVNDVKGNNFNAVKASPCWVWKPKHKVLDHGNPQMDLQDQGVIDSGCSRYMIGNMSYLTNYEKIDGEYVAFGGNPKGGKITGKDHLGKFDGKADEGFFVGYSLNSKAFRVFNSRTRIVEENLHIRFSESTPNAVHSLMVLQTADPPYSQDPKSSHDARSKPLNDDGKKVDEDPRKDSECNDQEKEDNVNNTNNVNAASTNEVNDVGGKTSIELPFDLNMPDLEDYSIFDFSRNDEDDGADAHMNNLDTTIQVSPIPTTRIHKDHPLDTSDWKFNNSGYKKTRRFQRI
ncbi:putative ribonuclease H-like domain-containing protein [Tanacetum coccineum]